MRLFLPLLIPFGVLLIGSWRLSVESTTPTGNSTVNQLQPPGRPSYSVPPPGDQATCQDDPTLDQALLREGHRLGVRVVSGQPELAQKDATYRAERGRLGTITLKPRPMSSSVRCMLISHEFIHVLQHLYGELKGVKSLGWQTTSEGIQRFGSIQEAEAYRYQNHAGHVLKLLEDTTIQRL